MFYLFTYLLVCLFICLFVYTCTETFMYNPRLIKSNAMLCNLGLFTWSHIRTLMLDGKVQLLSFYCSSSRKCSFRLRLTAGPWALSYRSYEPCLYGIAQSSAVMLEQEDNIWKLEDGIAQAFEVPCPKRQKVNLLKSNPTL